MDELNPPLLLLGNRMQCYEATYDTTLPSGSPIPVRVDGHTFSKFTSHPRPPNQRIHDAMVLTFLDLLTHFPPATLTQTQSNEITLVFSTGNGAFNDRVQKIATLAAAYCSAHFNFQTRVWPINYAKY